MRAARRRGWRAIGVVLIGFGAGFILGALLLGPWTVSSFDDLLSAAIPQRVAAGVGGAVLIVVGWIACGSDERA